MSNGSSWSKGQGSRGLQGAQPVPNALVRCALRGATDLIPYAISFRARTSSMTARPTLTASHASGVRSTSTCLAASRDAREPEEPPLP